MQIEKLLLDLFSVNYSIASGTMKTIVLFVVFLVVMNVQAFMYKNTRLLFNRGQFMQKLSPK